MSNAPSSTHLRFMQIITVLLTVSAALAALYLRDHLQQLAPYGYAAVFGVGLISNATLILPVPGLAVTSVMGAVFHPLIIGLVGGLGQALGELTGYLAGYSGQALITDTALYRRMTVWMQRYGVGAIFVLAALPNPFFDVAGIIAGALQMPVAHFLAATITGKIIKNIAFAYLGDWGSAVLRIN